MRAIICPSQNKKARPIILSCSLKIWFCMRAPTSLLSKYSLARSSYGAASCLIWPKWWFLHEICMIHVVPWVCWDISRCCVRWDITSMWQLIVSGEASCARIWESAIITGELGVKQNPWEPASTTRMIHVVRWGHWDSISNHIIIVSDEKQYQSCWRTCVSLESQESRVESWTHVMSTEDILWCKASMYTVLECTMK